tara:strand:+ start:3178 stop:3978 length:801 start_codon:yes stop_codon:yes gene_type:complete
MTKINIDKAQNINIIAKRGDDFNLSLTITSEDGTPVNFNNLSVEEEVTQKVNDYLDNFPNAGANTVLSNGFTASEFFQDTLNNFDIKNPGRNVLLFTITDMGNKPVLIACSETLNIAEISSITDDGGTETKLRIIARRYANAVAKVVAGYAGRNNGEARNNYGTESVMAIDLGVESITTTDDDQLNSIFNANFEGYIAKGNITSQDGITQSIVFKNSDFKLQSGNYKYTLRRCYQLRYASNFSGFFDSLVFRNIETYLVGKIKVTE